MAHVSLKSVPKDVKLCISCRHFRPDPRPGVEFGHCQLLRTVDLVSGRIEPRIAAIARVREDECGVGARHHQPKEGPGA